MSSSQIAGLASHVYSRSARALLPKLLITARASPTSPTLRPRQKPPRRRTPAPVPALAPAPRLFEFCKNMSFPPSPDGGSGSSR
eukprot:6206731-Pleurochrysis_carterae.AAC.1